MSVSLSTPPSTDINRRLSRVVLAQLIVKRASLADLDRAAGHPQGYFSTKIKKEQDWTASDLAAASQYLKTTPANIYETAESLSPEQLESLVRNAFLETYPCLISWCKNCNVEDEWRDGLIWNIYHGADFEPVQVRQSEHLDLRTGKHKVAEQPAFELMDSELQGTAQAFEAATAFFRLAEDVLAAQRAARGEANLVGAL